MDSVVSKTLLSDLASQASDVGSIPDDSFDLTRLYGMLLSDASTADELRALIAVPAWIVTTGTAACMLNPDWTQVYACKVSRFPWYA